MSKQTPAKQLFDLLVTKNFEPELLDSLGKPSPDPQETEVFSFDYSGESGKDYGTVVIMLADDNDLQVYFGDNLGKGMEGSDKTDWFDFLYELKNFATKIMMSFSPKNLNRLRYSMQGQAALKEGIFESWTGTRTTSWNGRPTEARLMIKHKRPLGENDARFRYVESLFIETAEGERYKLPFTKLSGGRAMVEHVRNGGRPHDARGQHITEMVTELNVLSRFRRANHGKIFEGDTAQLVEQTNAYYEGLQKTLKGLSKGRGYTSYFESWNPNVITEEDAVVEGLKHLFVTQNLDSRIEDALPLLAKIQEQGNAMKEANIFEAWAAQLVEGTWQLPDDKEKQMKLVELLSKDFPVGPDATNATEQLYSLLGDDELFDQLEALAEKDANADCRQVVLDRMAMLSDHPEVQAVINAVQVDPTAEMNPAEPTDAGASANPDDAQIPTNEEDLEDVESIGGDSSDKFMADVMTNQQGDEIQENDLDAILRIAGVPSKERPAPDYELEEAGEGTTAHIIKKILDPIAGAMGAAAGSGGKAILIQPIGEEETDEETDVTTAGEKIAGMTVGGGLGTLAGAGAGMAMGGPVGAVVGGVAGGALGAGLGNKVAQRAGNKNVANNLNAGANDFKQTTEEGEITQSAKKIGDKIGDVFNAPSDVVASTVSKIWHGDSKHPDIDEGIVDTIKGLAGIKKAEPATPPPINSIPKGTAELSAVLDAPNSPTAAGFSNSMIEDGKEETDEGWKGQLAGGTIGSLAGGAAGSALGPIGSAIGSAAGGTAGQMIGDKLGGEEKETPLQGKYGHSGKMKEVSEHADFLTRLKELSGMMRSDKI